MPTHALTDELTDTSLTDDPSHDREAPTDAGTSDETAVPGSAADDDKADPSDDSADSDETADAEAAADDAGIARRRISWSKVVANGIMPALVLFLAAGVGFLKWQEATRGGSDTTAAQSVSAATDTTVAILSYHADTADKELTAARDRLTGTFRDDYTKLINELVIPGAREKKISVTASVPQAASVSATSTHAVVLLYVNQTTNIGSDPPSDTASAVLVTLDKDGDKWLVSKFDPV